jgi:CheY-like chemotaxis protein
VQVKSDKRFLLEATSGRPTGRVHQEKADAIYIFASPVPTNRDCVLVIDNDHDQVSSLAMLLDFWGYNTVVAFDGASGLDLAKIHGPAAVLLDIGLPAALNGYELARALRDGCHFDQKLIIAITGHAQKEDREKCLEAGCDYHLAKPANPKVVLHLLKKHFDKNRNPWASRFAVPTPE